MPIKIFRIDCWPELKLLKCIFFEVKSTFEKKISLNRMSLYFDSN